MWRPRTFARRGRSCLLNSRTTWVRTRPSSRHNSLTGYAGDRSPFKLPVLRDTLRSFNREDAMKVSYAVATSLVALGAALTLAQSTQPQDEEYARLVKERTTRPEFMSPLVDHLPKAAGVPSPKDVLGYYIGAPKKLTYTADIYRYYNALAAASKRVKVLSAGKTDEGREQIVTVIADEDTIRNLDRYKADLARLADPRGLDDAAAQRIIAQAKPIYLLMGGLHSSET